MSQSTDRRQAQPHSIQAIIRDNCGLRLYVPPIAWTSDQLRLLTCHFNLQKGRGKQAHDNGGRVTDGTTQIKPERWRHSQLMRTATKLARISTLVAKKFAVEEILNAYDIHISDYKCLSFYFNHRPVVKLATDGVFSSNSVTPSLAYITFDSIQSLRKKHVYTPPYRMVNVPGLRLRQKKLDSLTPQNPVEDPYIAAILIALAQEQRRRLQQEGSQGEGGNIITKNQTSHMDADTTSTARSSSPSTEQMALNTANSFKVLALSGVAADALYVYTANIPSGFLDKFDEPLHYSPSCPVAITYCRVPLASSNLLRKLHRLLCAGSCSFCSCN
ncbi:hypothetical protein N7519_001793 [Penicillium mononematosum]|uniref:uncharacterized protein n=1 Tax=Penicillium mononematosum TaxID=268346 RepID=UPI002546FE31|nr:uncharacterized protein N7519_001793 [Penicillium mononematosum]KAJ6186885.1 hypothetical protein N7519_001793 [Penicillium mononematosum]